MPAAWLLLAFALYIATFAAFAFPWLRHMDHRVSAYPYVPDAKLIVWILSWVAHALIDPVSRVFDANIYSPAPAQLTGSEHFFALQPIFAPLYLLTGKPLVATGIVTFLTYPLGALAMAALLCRLGCSRLVAWLCGLTYALGVLRVPINFHTLQYPNLFLPMVALAAVGVCEAPGLKHGLLLFLALSATFLTSYYIAVIACFTLALWVVADLPAAGRNIVAFSLTLAVSTIAAILVAGLVLRPYLARSEEMIPQAFAWELGSVPLARLVYASWERHGEPRLLLLAPLALLGLGSGNPAWRRMVRSGAVLFGVGGALAALGLPDWLGQLAEHTPLRNLRSWLRMVLIPDFGLILLIAAGLHVCMRRFARPVGLASIVALVVLVTLPRLWGLTDVETFTPKAVIERASAYRTVDEITRKKGRGPLLELPPGRDNDREAMLGSTLHWLPLVAGSTGHGPAHAWFMRNRSFQLPDRQALLDLVDMSHLRWILLRPIEDWPTPQRARLLREGLAKSDLIGQSFSFDGFTLFEVTAAPQRPQWYQTIARGGDPTKTLVGTPVRRLSREEAIAEIEPLGAIRYAGRDRIRLRMRVHNRGTADWPVLVGPGPAPFVGTWVLEPLTVFLESRWTPLFDAPPEATQDLIHYLRLDQDVPAGESIVATVDLSKPAVSGSYQLDVRVIQKEGSEFVEPPSRMLRDVVEIQSRRSDLTTTRIVR